MGCCESRELNLKKKEVNKIDRNKLDESKLKRAFKKLESKKFKKSLKSLANPYGDGNSSQKILDFVLKTKIDKKLMFKKMTY